MLGGSSLLGLFKNRLSGWLWWDAISRCVRLGWPSRVQHLASGGSVSRGYLALAAYREVQHEDKNGDLVTTGLMEHGFQEVFEEPTGRLAVLSVDPTDPTTRFDVLSPVPIDLLSSDIPEGLRRLAYAIVGGVVSWYAPTGAAWGQNELVPGDTAKNYMPALALVDGKWKLTWRVFTSVDKLDAGHYVMLARPTVNINGTVEKLSMELVPAGDFLARLFAVEHKQSTPDSSVQGIAETASNHETRIDAVEKNAQAMLAAPTTGTWETGKRVWNSTPSLGSPAGWVCVAGGTPGTWEPFGGVSVDTLGSAAPTAGTWRRGDRCWDSTPSSGGQVGWVCTAAGTPGTWKSFGTIA